jgi:hypothetical protein
LSFYNCDCTAAASLKIHFLKNKMLKDAIFFYATTFFFMLSIAPHSISGSNCSEERSALCCCYREDCLLSACMCARMRERERYPLWSSCCWFIFCLVCGQVRRHQANTTWDGQILPGLLLSSRGPQGLTQLALFIISHHNYFAIIIYIAFGI